ncbi:hypothetical protein DFP72DRAFT_791523, partial [Ephemerocybe angulata]
RWGRHKPTLAGRCRAATAIVGSFTQYLTRVQGMPEATLDTFEKIIDDFVFDKGGAKKANAVAIATLKAPLEEGGFKLIDLRSRNEAIALMMLQRYQSPTDKRPIWVAIAEPLLASAAVSRFQNVTHSLLSNPFTQSWRVFLQSKSLPTNLKTMLSVAAKYNAQCVPITITPELRDAMPFWYHIGR